MEKFVNAIMATLASFLTSVAPLAGATDYEQKIEEPQHIGNMPLEMALKIKAKSAGGSLKGLVIKKRSHENLDVRSKTELKNMDNFNDKVAMNRQTWSLRPHLLCA